MPNKPGCGTCDAGCGHGATRAGKLNVLWRCSLYHKPYFLDPSKGITGVVPQAPSIVGNDAFSRIYFGGSGGASGCHNGADRNSAAGGPSGGIVIVAAKGDILFGQNGAIWAKGGSGQNGYYAPSAGQPQGGGGGGAGGSVLLISPGGAATASVDVRGGNGGTAASGGSCSPSTAGSAFEKPGKL